MTVDHEAPFRQTGKMHFIAAAVHGSQLIILGAIANWFYLPVTLTIFNGPPGAKDYTSFHINDCNLTLGIILFFALAFMDHLYSGVNIYFFDVEAYSYEFYNSVRWCEYSVSATIMLLLIAMLTGIQNLLVLLLLVFSSVYMIYCGYLTDNYIPERNIHPAFWYGVFWGLCSWIIIFIQLIATSAKSSVPGFVYGIYFSMFVAFSLFPLNMYFHCNYPNNIGNHKYQRIYIWLSIIAKSALAWQIYAGTLT